MNIKDMKRSDWQRCLQKDYIARDFDYNGQHGTMSLHVLRKLTAPLTIHYSFGDVVIADEGYRWLQIALKDRFFWLTAMYDSAGQLIEIYFDITAGNCFDNPENPCFRDMYLDIVVVPDKGIYILDQDELEEALAENVITQAEYGHAEAACRQLYEYLTNHTEEVFAFCHQAYDHLMVAGTMEWSQS